MDATSGYLTSPPFVEPSFIRLVEDYWSLLSAAIDFTASIRNQPGKVRLDQADVLEGFVGLKEKLDNVGSAIEKFLSGLLAQLSTTPKSVG